MNTRKLLVVLMVLAVSLFSTVGVALAQGSDVSPQLWCYPPCAD